MQRFLAPIVALTVLIVASAAPAAESRFVEGRHYTRLSPAVAVSTPAGKVEVVEVFSYGCIACFQAQPTVLQLKQRLGAAAQLVYVPAAFNSSEAWPMFQRAYLTAQVMGIAEKNHDAMFDAIWRTGELRLVDPASGRLRSKLPTIEDAARFYAKRAGIKAADFIATSKSFAVETRVARAEQLVRAYLANSTPTFVVAGKYQVQPSVVGSYDATVELIRYLVAKESGS